jgi:hypothetical protein
MSSATVVVQSGTPLGNSGLIEYNYPYMYQADENRRKCMTTQSATKVTSKGTCNFCKGEIDKAKMTQHLKYCKQRLADNAAKAQDPTLQKSRLFHLLIEGRYNPEYWMHIEFPSSEPLATLDSFLRRIWVECCGHLSAFKIGDTNYSDEREGFYISELDERGEVEEVEEGEEEEEKELTPEEVAQEMKEFLSELQPERVPAELFAELTTPRSPDDLVTFIKEKIKAIPSSRNARTPEEWEAARSNYDQRSILALLLDMVEDRSLWVPLEKVLKVGQKFFYDYDFGSTTYLALKVMSEREGALKMENQPAKLIMARNIAPGFACVVCGKPAKKVVAGYYNVRENAYCTACAKKSEYDEMMLPIVNSPRVGVCGYTGRD